MTAAPYLLPAPEPETWLSREQVLDLTSWSTEWLRRQVNGNVIVSRLTSFPSRNGKPERIYLLSSLPEDAQAKHSRPTLQIAPKAQVVTLTGPLFVGVAPESPRAQLTDPDDIAQADERYAILKPLLKFKDDPSRFLSIRLDDGSRITSEARLIQWLSNQQDVSPKTLKRYKQRYLEGGWAALADRKRSDSGESRWFNRYPEAKLLAAYVYLEQRQSVTVAWEAIKRDHTWLGIPADDLPSYETVRAALQTVTPTLRILAREGAVKYREMCAVYLSRAYSEYSNQIWVSDHAIIDVELFNDCFPEQPYGTPIRLRFTCLLDFRARFVVGYSWAWEGSSRSIATAMRHAISAYGPPEEFYCDNGADFRKVAKGAMPAYLRETALTPEGWYDRELQELDKLGLMARCGIAVRHCLVRHPQSKHVERFFRTMHETFDKKWPTYTGGRPDRRPDLTEAAMASHRKLMRHGQVERSRHPRASLFMSCFEAWLDEYHHKLHRGSGHGRPLPCGCLRAGAQPAPAPRSRAAPAGDDAGRA
jgi:putative transposase